MTTSETVINAALEAARKNARKDLEPVYEAYSQIGETLRKVEADIEKVLESANSGQAVGALWDMLNERAFRLQFERDQLLLEQRRLKEQFMSAEIGVDDHALRNRLQSLEVIRKTAQPEELQRLLRLMVRRVEWSPQGKHKVQLYVLPTKKRMPADLKSRQAVVSYCDALQYPTALWRRTPHLRDRIHFRRRITSGKRSYSAYFENRGFR